MALMSDLRSVWVFNGARSQFPSGIFSSVANAETWIRSKALTGTLTQYPIDISAYEWALNNRYFTPRKPEQESAEFIGRFSDASQEHYHYENGERA